MTAVPEGDRGRQHLRRLVSAAMFAAVATLLGSISFPVAIIGFVVIQILRRVPAIGQWAAQT